MKHFLHKLTFLLTWLFDTNESDLILFLLTLPEQVCWSHIQGDTNAVQTSSKSCDPAWYVCFPSLRFLVLKSTISFEFQNLSGKYTSLKNPMRLFHSNCLPEQKLLVLFDVPCYPSIILSKEMVDLKCLLVLLYDLVDINSVEDKNLKSKLICIRFLSQGILSFVKLGSKIKAKLLAFLQNFVNPRYFIWLW